MISAPVASPVLDQNGRRCEALVKAALSYAALGWHVLPGPVCDGLASWHPVTAEQLSSTEPTVSVEDATTDPDTIKRWWRRYPHTILAPAGDVFDVIRAPTPIAAPATAAMASYENLGPVAVSADGTRFFVQPGSTLMPQLAGGRGMEISAAGSLIALPPSRVLFGVASWWIAPASTQGRLGDADSIQAALYAAGLPLARS